MPKISPADSYLTVQNVFFTDVLEKQYHLLNEMRAIVDTAAFPGWISSTVHSGQDKPGTLNFIQWRSAEDLEARYDGEKFKHHTVPLFHTMTTSMMLLQNEVAYTQEREAGKGATIEISPERGDYTVWQFYGVKPEGQDDVVDALGASREWLSNVPGYRSHIVLRGVGARYFDGPFVICYSQWDDKETADAFRNFPEEKWPKPRRLLEERVRAATIDYQWNTFRVVHTRSAGQ